ncbi:TetR/AcrR family transcriptional regulator [Nocardia sp. NPDC058058]|uniref:TetR/AcrR family transcriptional regulator n=1 Tax=Nocardia sp. NPDC058058 TaxID=3346317 RepID=UPI0036D8A734
MPERAQPRRSQAERRIQTRDRLVEATIESIVELGYARTTAAVICRRSGVSRGGLFGRFDTVADLIAAAAAEVGQRQIAQFEANFAQLADPGDRQAVLLLLRESARRPINAVWTELMVAARTDADLRRCLQPTLQAYAEAIARTAGTVPILSGVPPERALIALKIILGFFDGDALYALPFPDPELDRALEGPIETVFSAFLDLE